MQLASPKALLFGLFGLGLGVFEFTLAFALYQHTPAGQHGFGDWFLLIFALSQILLSLAGLVLAIIKPKK